MRSIDNMAARKPELLFSKSDIKSFFLPLLSMQMSGKLLFPGKKKKVTECVELNLAMLIRKIAQAKAETVSRMCKNIFLKQT